MTDSLSPNLVGGANRVSWSPLPALSVGTVISSVSDLSDSSVSHAVMVLSVKRLSLSDMFVCIWIYGRL